MNVAMKDTFVQLVLVQSVLVLNKKDLYVDTVEMVEMNVTLLLVFMVNVLQIVLKLDTVVIRTATIDLIHMRICLLVGWRERNLRNI